MARDTVEEIKRKLTIQDVVTPYVKLTRAGKALKGLCPFHKEKTPSFTVSIDRGSYHCFGCGEGGDMFSFIEKMEGVDFKGALKLLADKAGVEIVYDPAAREIASRTERLREAMTRAVEFYISRMPEGSEAYKYALSRGLSPATIKEWQLGYAPDDWRTLLTHLAEKGFKTDELLSAGLIKEADGKNGTYYDRFRNRLMFPIRDTAGRTVAFTGRALDPNDQAKYLNSPETELYHKSEILFGMDHAKDAIRTRGFALLMEGQMDLLHAHQAGFTNTIALSGTAFTAPHAKLLLRYAENLMLSLDGDSAGLTATAKSAHVALREGMRVKAVKLPEGKDPADVINSDAKEFAKRVTEAKPVVEFFLDVIMAREPDPHRLVLRAERVVLPLIRAVKSPMEQEHFISVASRSLSLSAEAIRASLAKVPRLEDRMDEPSNSSRPITQSSRAKREDLVRAIPAAYPNSALAQKVTAEYARIVEAPLPSEPPPESALFEAEQLFGENPGEGAADELLYAFEDAVIREALEREIMNIRRAESSGDRESIRACEAAVAKLQVRLGALHH